MTTQLDRLLEFIDPDRNLDETFNRANNAINTFTAASAQIEHWDNFRYCLAEFLRYVESEVLARRIVDEAISQALLNQLNRQESS